MSTFRRSIPPPSSGPSALEYLLFIYCININTKYRPYTKWIFQYHSKQFHYQSRRITFTRVDVCLLGSKAVRTCREVPTFRRNILPPYSALKMEAVCSSKTLVCIYKSSRLYNPKHQHRHLHHRENLKSHIRATRANYSLLLQIQT
jgi:hypothetical protein